MKTGDDIRYFKDFNSFNQSLYSNFPDPSLGYMDNTTGSDMFDVLKKFLKNTVSLCGSTVVIAAKRYPNEVEIEDLISNLQKNHVFVYIIASDTQSGGSNPSAMFNLATRTNGYCVFSARSYLDEMYSDASSLALLPNQIAASKFSVSGKGRQTVPIIEVSPLGSDYGVEFEIVFQDHKVDGSLISLNFTLTDEFGNEYPYAGSSYVAFFFIFCCQIKLFFHFGYTGFQNFFFAENATQYYLNIDYEYQEGRQEVMVVRIYCGNNIPNNWLPFNN
ncbi:unnamed protein product [Caenorhabditis brenneri]